MRPFQALKLMLILMLGLLSFVGVLFALFSLLHYVRIYLGCQENGFTVWVLCVFVLLEWRLRGTVWQLGLACAACNLLAYWAFRMHREDLRQAFDSLGDIMILISLYTGRGWGRKIGQKLKSVALTAVNAASFKRQTAEVLSCENHL